MAISIPDGPFAYGKDVTDEGPLAETYDPVTGGHAIYLDAILLEISGDNEDIQGPGSATFLLAGGGSAYTFRTTVHTEDSYYWNSTDEEEVVRSRGNTKSLSLGHSLVADDHLAISADAMPAGRIATITIIGTCGEAPDTAGAPHFFVSGTNAGGKIQIDDSTPISVDVDSVTIGDVTVTDPMPVQGEQGFSS